jgi:hypothetical protein
MEEGCGKAICFSLAVAQDWIPETHTCGMSVLQYTVHANCIAKRADGTAQRGLSSLVLLPCMFCREILATALVGWLACWLAHLTIN